MAKMIVTERKLGELYENKRTKVVQEDETQVYKTLAYCFQELNKQTATEKFIIKRWFWTTIDGDGDKIYRFKFHVRYDENNERLYVYEFIKCRFLGEYYAI